MTKFQKAALWFEDHELVTLSLAAIVIVLIDYGICVPIAKRFIMSL